MSLNDRLLADMKEAMKEREAGKIRLSTIRSIRAAQKEAEIEKRQELTDDELIQVINRELKMRRESLAGFEQAGRADTIQRLQTEISILQTYLPEQLGENEIRAIVQEIISKLGASGPQDVGKVMKNVIPEIRGRADGKLVNQLVKELLA